jgi:hypothetical protein
VFFSFFIKAFGLIERQRDGIGHAAHQQEADLAESGLKMMEILVCFKKSVKLRRPCTN